MQIRLLSVSNPAILELIGAVTSLEDALHIVSSASEHSTHRVLLRAHQLPWAFFQLQTRFAGDFVQKLVNYRLAVAGVFPDDLLVGERFREYVREAGQGRQFRSFTHEQDAIAWLERQ